MQGTHNTLGLVILENDKQKMFLTQLPAPLALTRRDRMSLGPLKKQEISRMCGEWGFQNIWEDDDLSYVMLA